jgi:ABC-type molybdate transport system ATPase subunit
MIGSDAIKIYRENCESIINEETLEGVVVSIEKQVSLDDLCVEFTIGGINFKCSVSREVMQKQRFLPGDKIYINIDTLNVRWWTL